MRTLAFLSLSLVVACAPTALAQGFKPNHVFVTDRNHHRVVEMTLDGTVVRTFGPGQLNQPTGLAFGPNGNLFVCSWLSSEVVEFAPDGSVVDKHSDAALVEPDGIVFGPGGAMFVSCFESEHVVVFEEGEARVLGATAGLDGPTQLAFGPDGHLFVAEASSGRVTELDPSGVAVRRIGATTLDFSAGVTIGIGGQLVASDVFGSEVYTFDANGDVVATFKNAAMNAPRHLVGGPDFAHWVVADGSGRLVSFRGDQLHGVLGEDAGFFGIGGIAFAPFRFKVEVNGTRTGSPKHAKFRAKGILSIAPGSNTVMLHFPDPAAGPNEVESLLGQTTFVFHGREGVRAPEQKQRRFIGIEVRAPQLERTSAFLSLDVRGKVDVNGAFRPKKVLGTFEAGRGDEAVHARIVTKKRLK